MKLPKPTVILHMWKSAALAILSAILFILAFPDFEFWFLAWFGLVPLLWAVEKEKESTVRTFVLGWLWGYVFFSGTCWWLTFAPITYAGFPTWLAYVLLFCVTGVVAIFPGVFAAVLAFLLRRLGSLAFLAAPFVWVCTEFLRSWITGNNWNALGYSQAFSGFFIRFASIGGIYLTSFLVFFPNLIALELIDAVVAGVRWILQATRHVSKNEKVEFVGEMKEEKASWTTVVGYFLPFILVFVIKSLLPDEAHTPTSSQSKVIAIQPNVPMSGLTYEKWKQLRQKHVELAESALTTINDQRSTNTTVIFPESPMNFAYEEDEEFRNFVHAFAAKHDVQVLFNSAEPDAANDKYFNSAVLVGPDGSELAQYDKIYLLPFGESVPAPLQSIVPAFVGSFSYGKEYDLLPIGDAKAGVMICFESHFGELGREYVRNGADALIEMTNDGYLGPTPVLRQHLANAVFRAVETNRPVLRVTNVGVTAYIDEEGMVHDPAESYGEATRVWTVAKSDGLQTFYVKYGDWFAWLCSIVTIGMLGWSLKRRRVPSSE